MAHSVLIIGSSGSGKSTSIGQIPELGIEGLNPKETIILNALGKELPFRGSKRDYPTWDKDNKPDGNMIITSKPKQVLDWIIYINKSRPDIKNIILDDNTHNSSMEYTRRISEKNYDKFNDISFYMASTASIVKEFRDDLCIFFLHHSREVGDGIIDVKRTEAMTIGKLVDDKLSGYESFFTVVLRAVKTVEDEKIKYNFLTQDAFSSAKTPIGMFSEVAIPNDLGYVKRKMEEYYNGN